MSKQLKIIIFCFLGLSFTLFSVFFIFINKNTLKINTKLSEVGSANASQDTKNFPIPEVVSSMLKNKAWYVATIGNIPIGLISVGVEDLNSGFPSNFTAQFVSRIGSSPLLSNLRGDLAYEENGSLKLQQYLLSQTENGAFKEIQNIWKQDKDSNLSLIKDMGASLQGIIPASFLRSSSKSKIIFDDNIGLFYYIKSEKRSKINKVFIPFVGSIVNVEDISAKYDDDGFLNAGKIVFDGGGELNFSRIEKSKFADLSKSISETLLDFGWFSSLSSIKIEFDTLKKSLDNCASRTASLSKKMLQYLPQSSYLSYRRVINMSHFCSNLSRDLSNKDLDSYDQKLVHVASAVKTLLKENTQELPYFLAYSPDTILFYNDTISFLWPRITALLAQTALYELENNFELDKNRKSLVGIQLNIANLQSRAVVRAQIKLIDSSLNFIIDGSRSANMNPSSITAIPKLLDKALPSIYLNGQFFAKSLDLNIDHLCKLNSGKIGIDLGDAPQLAINTNSIRGVWDIQTRIEIARQFAIKSTISKSCENIYFKIPSSIEKAISKELEQFKSEVLGTENELLLSNNIQKKLWIIPGKYRIIVNSVVTGAVLSVQEFNVSSGMNTSVVAKIN